MLFTVAILDGKFRRQAWNLITTGIIRAENLILQTIQWELTFCEASIDISMFAVSPYLLADPSESLSFLIAIAYSEKLNQSKRKIVIN